MSRRPKGLSVLVGIRVLRLFTPPYSFLNEDNLRALAIRWIVAGALSYLYFSVAINPIPLVSKAIVQHSNGPSQPTTRLFP